MIYYILESIIPYFFILAPLIIIQIVMSKYYKNKAIIVSPGHIVGFQLFVLLLIIIFNVTGTGCVTDIGKYGDQLIRLNEISLIPFFWGSQDLFGLLMNIVIFIPIGIALPLLWKNQTSPAKTFLYGMFLSVIIETSQLLNIRATDIDDILMNSVGTLAGFFIYKFLLKNVKTFQLSNEKDGFLIKNAAILTILSLFLLIFFK